MALLGPPLAAMGIYGLLRWVVWAPGGGTSPKSVSDHALWVGVIGWLASTLQGAANAGIIPLNPQTPSLQQPADILKALAWPVAGCLGVHALGQLSYPGPRGPRGLATLSVRRVRDFLPRKLAWTTLSIFAGAAATIAWAATKQAYRPLPYASPPYGAPGPTVGGDGRIAGTELASCLGAALLLLVAGTTLVLWLISRRRQLEALNVRDLRSEKHPAAVLTVSLGAILGLAAVAPGFAVLILLGSTNPVRATVISAVMATSVLVAILAGELLLDRNYGADSAVRRWPVQPVAPALLAAAIIGLLLLAVVIVMTSVGEAALPSGAPGTPGWIPTAVATAAVAVTAVPATLAVRRRRGILTSADGLDAALRAVTLNRIVRILAAVLLAQAGGLLISANRAWGVLLGTQTVPAELWEAAQATAGYVRDDSWHFGPQFPHSPV